MRPADVCIALLVAVIWGLAFVASRIALDEFSPALMTTLRFTIAFAVIAFGDRPTPMQTVGIGVATIGLFMICGTVGYDFSVGAFAVLMISPISFAAGNLLLRRANGVPML